MENHLECPGQAQNLSIPEILPPANDSASRPIPLELPGREHPGHEPAIPPSKKDP